MNDYITYYQNVIGSHFMSFPVGLIILSPNQTEDSRLIISYINNFASEILPMKLGTDINIYNDLLTSFKKRELTHLSDATLWDSIFNSNLINSDETFFSEHYMIYVKIKFHNEFIYITIDNVNEQRQTLQDKIIKSISFKFLTTLAHEINNPLNSLITSLEPIKSSVTNRIKLLVCLIKSVIQKLIVYSKSFFDKAQCKDKNSFISSQSENINLQFLFTKVTKKLSLLFDYKHIIIDTDFSLIGNYQFKSDRYYLKQLVKNIWLYLYYQVPTHSKICMITIMNNDSIKMTFQHEGIKPQKAPISKDSGKHLLNESTLVLDATVNTIDTYRDILFNISSFLDVQVSFIEENNAYVSIEFKNVVSVQNNSEDDDDEEVDECINTIKENKNIVPTFSALSTFDYLKHSKKKPQSTPSVVKDIKSAINYKESEKKVDLSRKQRVTFPDNQEEKCGQSTADPNNLKEDNNDKPEDNNPIFGRSLTKYFKSINDPVIDNIRSPLTNSRTFKRDGDSMRATSTIKEDDIFLNKEFQGTSSFKFQYDSKQKVVPIGFGMLNNLPKKPTLTSEIPSNNILLVDDESYNLESIQNLLKKYKLTADICVNGQESIQYLKKNPNVKLLFMDVYMPILNGIEACKIIDEMVKKGEINPKINVIILSAHSPETIQYSSFDLKVVKEFVTKPLSFKKLHKILQDFYQ